MTFSEFSSSSESLTFTKLGLNSALIKALPAMLQCPTLVQQLAIPAILAGRDVLALAQTGSGKTLAFGLPLLQSVLEQQAQALITAQALVLVPTRELAQQVTLVLQAVAQPLSGAMKIQTLCGGVDIDNQLIELAERPQILVATPGRILDLCKQSHITLDSIKHLVLDEADRLLEMGFWPDVQKLIALMPKHKQTLLFSATLPEALNTLASQLLINDPLRVQAHKANSVVPHIEEQLYLVNKGSKTQALIALLKQYQWPQVLVFISARDDADAVAKRLAKAGMKVAALHGEKDQTVRSQTLADFKAKRIQILVATDLMARGIHIDALPVVVNLDLPMSAPVYVHRIGRTARAGTKGLAISLVCHGEMATLTTIRGLTERALPLTLLADFPVTDKPSEQASDGKVERKRPPRDKQANRRSINKHKASEFKGKR
ncbi:DEAD/DEAH box helicase [Shewanella sp. JNE10-2]|uniref:DEAD/DEAH box helicase n=1 Tax=unclassified Shewanella TaxID=196818 RepID=UPI002004E6B6|nr:MULTISPECIES: DEAD/DEAH box helicase [unclassified Shewanella]MCK7631325.1 DEAD/DEAH box helicase [Shewanella sp. JNE9-1]MCK7646625.1 DEAD/DEAH box helicase [Shewanella sp. JNE3-1]MCK7654487.1 DEAD/DEAH box helicase [Shewanella sp. JNE4-1]UPO27317.1 DEAD/DEAH box helicase [Shewanella sp. JNE10-2]UPO34524.1 DEAD/DEAH box helicase [Shewanella sp. JNE7]